MKKSVENIGNGQREVSRTQKRGRLLHYCKPGRKKLNGGKIKSRGEGTLRVIKTGRRTPCNNTGREKGVKAERWVLSRVL